MKLFFASGNRHKQAEIAKLFPKHEVLIPADCGIDFDPEENGNSFVENSLIKAKALFDIVKVPVIADDSGICVDALNGVPKKCPARHSTHQRKCQNRLPKQGSVRFPRVPLLL